MVTIFYKIKGRIPKCVDFSGIMPEVSIDPMKVVEDAVLEFSDKKDLFLAYMSSMLVGDQGMLSGSNAPIL